MPAVVIQVMNVVIASRIALADLKVQRTSVPWTV